MLSACLAHDDGQAGWSVFPNRFLLSLAAAREPYDAGHDRCSTFHLFFIHGDSSAEVL